MRSPMNIAVASLSFDGAIVAENVELRFQQTFLESGDIEIAGVFVPPPNIGLANYEVVFNDGRRGRITISNIRTEPRGRIAQFIGGIEDLGK